MLHLLNVEPSRLIIISPEDHLGRGWGNQIWFERKESQQWPG